jgi:hypothetical protein
LFRATTLKTVGRVAALVFLLAAMMGPWFADGHPATEETCRPPLVWLGDGYCACLITFIGNAADTLEDAFSGQDLMWMLIVPPALPVLTTLLLLLFGEHGWLRVCHLSAWGIAGIYAFLWFGGVWYAHRGVLILWGAGLGGVIAIAILGWEMLIARRQIL